MDVFKSRKFLCLVLLILAVVRPATAEITDEQARKSIAQALKYLETKQNKTGGGRSETWPTATPGVTALVTLAMLNAGVEVKSEVIQKALAYLRAQNNPENTYGTSLQTMVFCIAEPNRDRPQISRNVQWLENSQLKSGRR